ncbi:hypothetical protein E2C01_035656 [Portunus trituberculatus]|uniref:Uncharacterized protein n=1 Tax=Portunus trituberculatus TaxID=210409 RepID=A0A5B7FAC2_PORTR|nr:hypothetical protein [Portunus trituberculatus]
MGELIVPRPTNRNPRSLPLSSLMQQTLNRIHCNVVWPVPATPSPFPDAEFTVVPQTSATPPLHTYDLKKVLL